MLAQLNSNAYQCTECGVSVVGLAINKLVKRYQCLFFSGRQVTDPAKDKPVILPLAPQHDVLCLKLSPVVACLKEDALAYRLQ